MRLENLKKYKTPFSLKREKRSFTEEHIPALVREWILPLQPYDLILFEGELGAGKSTWVRAILEAEGFVAKLSPGKGSPTFSILHEYEQKGDPRERLFHLDFYREVDFESLGILDYLFESKGPVLIEWPDLWEDGCAKLLKTRQDRFSSGSKCLLVKLEFSEPGRSVHLYQAALRD